MENIMLYVFFASLFCFLLSVIAKRKNTVIAKNGSVAAGRDIKGNITINNTFPASTAPEKAPSPFWNIWQVVTGCVTLLSFIWMVIDHGK